MELKLTPRFLQNGQRFFGPGVAELLERVREHRSLRAAAASMEMAYSKAWRIIHEAEEGFGFRLLDSTIGGRGRPFYWCELFVDLDNNAGTNGTAFSHLAGQMGALLISLAQAK